MAFAFCRPARRAQPGDTACPRTGLADSIGTQDAALLDTAVSDADEDYTATEDTGGEAGEDGASEDTEAQPQGTALAAYQSVQRRSTSATSSACVAGSTGFQPSSSVLNLPSRCGPM